MKTSKINSFTGRHRFLSNFHEVTVRIKDKDYPEIDYATVEAAYQAAKFDKYSVKMYMAGLDARTSKMWAKRRPLEITPNFHKFKAAIMYRYVEQKFALNPDLAQQLLDTGDAYLEEGNWWNDKYWGVCSGEGENKLGKILMLVRKKLREGTVTQLA